MRRIPVICSSVPLRLTVGRASLVATAMLILIVLIGLPLGLVFVEALSKGLTHYFSALSHPDTVSAIRLTLMVSGLAVTLNVVFGIAAAWLLARHRFAGRGILLVLVDLPLSVSPVVAGMLFVLLFHNGPLAPLVESFDLKVIHAVPGIILATTFVTLPYVVRELMPVLETSGRDMEDAARTLGASGLQTFLLIVLPRVLPAILYGMVLCGARAIGEFGAVSVISGHIRGATITLPLHVEILYNEYAFASAFAAASLLSAIALLSLVLQHALERRSRWRTL